MTVVCHILSRLSILLDFWTKVIVLYILSFEGVYLIVKTSCKFQLTWGTQITQGFVVCLVLVFFVFVFVLFSLVWGFLFVRFGFLRERWRLPDYFTTFMCPILSPPLPPISHPLIEELFFFWWGNRRLISWIPTKEFN